MRVESERLIVEDGRDSLLLTAYGLRDSVKEVTTITIQLNDRGDTVNRSTVTERTIVRDRTRDSQLRVKSEKSRVDTVSVVQKDSLNRSRSLQVTGYGLQEDGTPTVSGKLSAVSKILKWIFAIIIASIVLIIIIKISLRKL